LSIAAENLGAQGPLARVLPYFTPRPAQQEMAARIEEAIAHGGVFVAESGTGTGKTFAYLVPALLSGRKVLISTGTRNLQDQLYGRDLPLVREALGVPVQVALLKGRSNYLCLQRFEQLEAEARAPRRAEDLARLRAWARSTRSGDIAEVSEIPENADLWPLVTSTSDNCLGGQCRRYDDCYVNRARREALAADVVIINHYLFFADLALREEGFGSLLPGAEAVIFDEAHQLPEIASSYFGVNLSSHQLSELCRDSVTEELRERSEVEGIAEAARATEKALADLRLAMGVEPRRATWRVLSERKEFSAAREQLLERLQVLAALLEKAAPKGQGLANVSRRAGELLDRLLMLGETPPPEYVAWFETAARGFNLHLTPLEVASEFRAHTTGKRAWVFTSATLAINGSFEHFLGRLGLEDVDTGLWASPFNYAEQALLYLPQGLPAPGTRDYTARVIDVAMPVLAASRGRAFLLFTSHRALREASVLLEGRLPYPLLVQGSAPRAELLDRFRSLGNAVLLGTGSFWEGVDVRGEALSCVIIDKLPFASPDDPVLAARAQALEEAGGNPFMDFQVPEAVIALKQGVGRLIRDEGDRGVLVLCDPRLRGKGYGRIFLNSLPPMRQTRDLGEVCAFFSAGKGRRSIA
jgi:ATP-dependent DNA helicase DinG